MTKTLDELAQTNLSDIKVSTGSIFNPDDTANKVLGALRDSNRTEAVAARGDRYGIISMRDLLGVDQPENTKIETIWKQVGSISPNSSVLDAVDFMIKNNVTAIPVVHRNEVSFLSQQNITDALIEVPELKSVKVRDVMMSPVVTMSKDSPIAQVRRVMLDKGFRYMPITNGERLVGIVTGEAIVRTFITAASKTTTGERSGNKVTRFPGQVDGFMDTQPVTISHEANLFDTIRRMSEMDEKYCLVVDEEDRLHGIITNYELLGVIHSLLPEPELPVYIVGIDGEDFFESAVVEEKIRRTVQRTVKMQEITEVRVMVKNQRNSGERTRYTVTARAMGPTVSFNVENEGWGLMEAFDGLIDALDKSLRRAKKDPQKGKRRGRRRPNPHLKP